jgi:tetratricopeptide (TPR) repeat protein
LIVFRSTITEEGERPRPIPTITSHQYAAYLLERQGEDLKELNPNQACSILVASSLEYLCQGDRIDAYYVQIQIGWILINQGRFSGAQAHFDAARRALDVREHLIVSCRQGLARAAQGLGNPDEAIKQYDLALVICRTRGYAHYEYIIVRERGEAILDHPRNHDPAENLKAQNEARRHFTEALSFAEAQGNLEYQAGVHCELVQLEQRAGREETAQIHAIAAFRRAMETGQRGLVTNVYAYLEETGILPEAQSNAFNAELQAMLLDETSTCK